MDQYKWVRTAHRVYKKSIRQIARETGHTRRTVRKVLAGQDPKYRREKEPACPVMDPVAGIVEGWLQADREQPAKQRHTAHRVWQRLVDEHGFTGAEPTVRRWVRERKMRLGWHRTGGRGAVGSGTGPCSRGGLGYGLGPDERSRPSGQVVLHEISVLGQGVCAGLSVGTAGDVPGRSHPWVRLVRRRLPDVSVR